MNTMTPKKPRKISNQRQHSHLNQISDYDTDTAALTDTGLPQPPPPSRTNEELNLAVLRRHNPSIVGVVSIAPYAVVYKFSATSSTWEKRGIEGTLFVVQLLSDRLGSENFSSLETSQISIARFGVVVLNRRGLENFEADLKSTEDVEITEEYVILQVSTEAPKPTQDGTGKQDQGPDIIGLWIFSEPPPSSTAEARVLNAQIIQECAKQAYVSRIAAENALREARQRQSLEAPSTENGPEEEYEDSGQEEVASATPMGRQLSLRQLFGQQRQDDDAWSVRGHNSPLVSRSQPGQGFQPQGHSRLRQQQDDSIPISQSACLHNTVQPIAEHGPPDAMFGGSVSSLQQNSLRATSQKAIPSAHAHSSMNRPGNGLQDQSTRLSGQMRSEEPSLSRTSQQDVLLGLFQRARDEMR